MQQSCKENSSKILGEGSVKIYSRHPQNQLKNLSCNSVGSRSSISVFFGFADLLNPLKHTLQILDPLLQGVILKNFHVKNFSFFCYQFDADLPMCCQGHLLICPGLYEESLFCSSCVVRLLSDLYQRNRDFCCREHLMEVDIIHQAN